MRADSNAATPPEAVEPLLLDARDVVVEYRIRVPRPLRRNDRRRNPALERRIIRAVDTVSLSLREGDAVGLIGSNGAGKSSLLRALAGLEPIAGGTVHAVSPPHLLGVGEALKPTWTGWETIDVGLRASGVRLVSRRHLAQEIADFTELGPYLDLPVSTYSRGMKGRLLFALSTAVARRVLFVDESLGGADGRFRKRAEERVASIVARSSAMLLVSHYMPTIARLTNRVLWMESGCAKESGAPEQVIARYEEHLGRG
jgi:ABC-type polysaccharide/polyol phosphate transport system ATPase subunit